MYTNLYLIMVFFWISTYRSNTLRYSILIASSWTFMSLMSLLTDFKHRKLTYREWVPYDYSSYMMFCITYVHQILSTFYCASVNVACDTLICGFLMHVYCQIEILEYRLKKILCDQSILDYCVHHHNSIFQLVILIIFFKNRYIYCIIQDFRDINL